MMHQRIKGETSKPINTLALLKTLGVTKAAKEIGTSTTTLHKARKNGIVSKVVETAATAVLDHLGDAAAAPKQLKAPEPAHDRRMFLLEVDADKAPLVEKFAELLRAEIISA